MLIILITLSFLSKRSELIFGEILIFLRLLIEYCVSILNSLILNNATLIREKIVGQLSEAGEFELKHKLKQELKVVALWLSVDGDDTKSSYSVQIDQIQLNSL